MSQHDGPELRDERQAVSAPPADPPEFSPGPRRRRRSRSRSRLERELEVPFDPALIQWRAKETKFQKGGIRQGFCLPYADPRAYKDRLNLLFTTTGWTNDFAVATTPTKVIVTCKVTLDVLGCKSATGEEWLRNANAATIAEAQAFKRACACFGLGRYLYGFVGCWLDLDEQMRPLTPPTFPEWATPEGWRRGFRPDPVGPKPVAEAPASAGAQNSTSAHNGEPKSERPLGNFKNVILDIRNMERLIGTRLYRGLLKEVARVFYPEDIRKIALQHKVLALMMSAGRGLDRLRSARVKVSDSTVRSILNAAELQSFDDIGDMATLQQVVLGLENAAVEARNVTSDSQV
jgi:hypothetical protein